MTRYKYEEWLTPEGLIRLRGWAMDGLTDDDICKNIGISRKTLFVWRKRYPDIERALKLGKDVADRNVENSLYSAAVKGNVTAMIFWLKNRKPEEWRDRIDRNTKMDNEEQRARIEKLKADTMAIKAQNDTSAEQTADDGFLEALNASAKEDWADEDA